ncbi:hypothetical protein Fcan01_11657 [Folsomia candida]|uniref:Uncharacterized protein n=1 Tax=Folsomia candida TaxID=158441 RepID=A0A226E9J1_FOLCA|nr:hypothetical protein Fcan01_11657 [Folsomia candida]
MTPLIFLFSLSPQIIVASLLSIRHYFASNNLHFVQWWRENGTTPAPYFYQIITNNPNSPIILTDIIVTEPFVGFFRWKEHLTSIQTSVALLDSNFEKEVRGFPIHFWLQRVTMKFINPAYIFQHASEPWNAGNFKKYEWQTGTSMIILFSHNFSGVAFIPCVTCTNILPTCVKTISFHKLDEVWRRKNADLAKRHVQVMNLINFQTINCGVTYSRMKQYATSDDCKIIHLSEFLNFSIIHYRSAKDPVTFLMVPKILNAETLATLGQYEFTQYSMGHSSTKFFIVTPSPSSLEGMNAFLLPFTATVWLVLLLTGVTICGLAEIVKNQKNPKKIAVDLIHLIAMLLKQVCCESSHIFGGNHIGPGVIWLWLFFGSNIIMDNLYTGEIFSYLSAIKVPQVADTLPGLVPSNIPILTFHGYSIAGPK